MKVLGIGTDLVETQRIEASIQKFGDRFLHRVFVEAELAYCHSMKFPARHLAARFAAKEAVSKAFGTGIGKAIGWREIEVRRKASGEPFLILHEGAKQFAERLGVIQTLISLSHTDNYATASAVVICAE